MNVGAGGGEHVEQVGSSGRDLDRAVVALEPYEASQALLWRIKRKAESGAMGGSRGTCWDYPRNVGEGCC